MSMKNSHITLFISSSSLSSPRFSFLSLPYRIQWKKLKDRLWKAIFTVISFILWIFLLFCMNVWIRRLKWCYIEVLEWWTIVYSRWRNCEWSLENSVRRWGDEETDRVVCRGLWNQELLATLRQENWGSEKDWKKGSEKKWKRNKHREWE